jgi:hypothetical protein
MKKGKKDKKLRGTFNRPFYGTYVISQSLKNHFQVDFYDDAQWSIIVISIAFKLN